MSVEIEHKFLVTGNEWRNLTKGVLLRQGYLSSHHERVVRVRVEDKSAMLTIKGKSQGASRGEWEYPIPLEDAQVFLDTLCEKPLIEKVRYRISYEGMMWEVDEFLGENQGLIVAEIELAFAGQPFVKPSWIGQEVTDDARYYNSNLLKHPYSQW